jgi:ArsR family transcriptional regulator
LHPAVSTIGPRNSLDVTLDFVTIRIVMSEALRFFKVVSDTTRWRIVLLVLDRALCVCELADILRMPQSSVSSHVQVIRRAGLLESETCGKWTYFRIASAHVSILRLLMRRFPDDGRFAGDAFRAERRLARRETSCCPGPVKLLKSRKLPRSAAR